MQETNNSLENDFDIDQKKLWTFLNRNNKSKSYSTNLVVNGKKCVSQRNIRETGTSLEIRNYNIDVTDIEKVLKTLKNNKATGFDNIAYEHLTYGGNCLKWHMMNLFNLVSANYYTPKPCKSSLIVPFFKGGSKCKDNLNSYRGISLAPCIGKVFDRIIESKLTLKKDNKPFPNQQQTAYQQGISCLHTSFNVQKSIYHHLERI
jgi:hypothetical protein